MRIFKKMKYLYSLLTKKYVPTPLPRYGPDLENFIPLEYFEKVGSIKESYDKEERDEHL